MLISSTQFHQNWIHDLPSKNPSAPGNSSLLQDQEPIERQIQSQCFPWIKPFNGKSHVYKQHKGHTQSLGLIINMEKHLATMSVTTYMAWWNVLST
jgi:hypothetical protein